MTDVPLPVAAAVIILGSVVVTVAGLLLARRIGRGQSPRHNDFVGLVFANVAMLFSVLLAFVVFTGWQRFSDAARSVTEEAAAAVVAYRDTQVFPEPVRSEAQAAFRNYVNEVMDNEWDSHGTVRPHRSRDAMNPIWNAYRKYQPTEPIAQAEFDGAQGRLHDLEHQRHLRHLATEGTLPTVFWWVLIGGGFCTVAVSYLYVMEGRRVQAVQVGVLSACIASVLMLILAMNYPFTGQVHVSRGPFRHALQNFTALDVQSGSIGGPLPARAETVIVDARRPFTDTGIDIAVGDRVAVSATGTIFHDASGSTGPNGVAERRDLQQFNVVNEENHGALIGRIGESGAPFAVGGDFASASLAPGRLYLGVNDAGLDNNRGAFTATVTVRRV